jgi:hypothetical protein
MFRASFRLAVYLRDDLECAYCNATVEDAPFTLDHIVSLRNYTGSTPNDSQNLTSACLSCNSRRSGMAFDKFVPKQSDRRRILRRAARLLPGYQHAAQVLLANTPPPWWTTQRELAKARARARGDGPDAALARIVTGDFCGTCGQRKCDVPEIDDSDYTPEDSL